MSEMLELIEKCSLLIALAVCAWIDWKRHEVYLFVPGIVTVLGLVLHILNQAQPVTELMAGAGLGVVLLFVAWITRESVGVGDAVIFMMTGCFMGFWNNLCLMLGAFCLAGVAALFLLVLKKKTRKERIPMIPYILVSYVVMLL